MQKTESWHTVGYSALCDAWNQGKSEEVMGGESGESGF